MRRILCLVAILVLAAGSAVSRAATITDFGIVFTLTQVGGGDSATRQFLLTLDTDGYTNTAGGGSFPATTHWLDGVDIKVSSQIDAAQSSLVSAIGPTGAALVGWTFTGLGLNSGGCTNGGGGFACASTTSTSNLLLPGGTGNGVGIVDYSFTFEVTSADGTFFPFGTEYGAHIGASYGRFGNVTKGHPDGIYSAGLTSVVTAAPEPEIYAMLAVGLGLMGFVARRRRQQAAA